MKLQIGVVVILLFLLSCETEKRIPPKGYIPNVAEATTQLEAQYLWKSQNKLNSSYWKDANYVEVSLTDKEKMNLYPEGILNATGTYKGLTDLNKGNDPQLLVKAGYDENYLYVWVEWKDTTANADYFNWFWNGPEDILKSDTVGGWTSQGNTDNISLMFKNSDNSFDVWKWALAYTAPFDMALNLKADEDGNISDNNNSLIERNTEGSTTRSGPQYEWNDERQELELTDGTVKLLDPSRYLLSDYKTPLIGDVESGQRAFNVTADCRFCHGINGNGIPDGYTDGGPLNLPFINKYTREGLAEFIGSTSHEGRGNQYWGRIKNNPTDVENLISFMRASGGIAGHILNEPATMPEIHVLSNISVGGIERRNSKYQLLFKRKLVSDAQNSISFNKDNSYKLKIRLSDNDELNYVESTEIELIFKSNEL